jgi:hypothetical protein
MNPTWTGLRIANPKLDTSIIKLWNLIELVSPTLLSLLKLHMWFGDDSRAHKKPVNSQWVTLVGDKGPWLSRGPGCRAGGHKPGLTNGHYLTESVVARDSACIIRNYLLDLMMLYYLLVTCNLKEQLTLRSSGWSGGHRLTNCVLCQCTLQNWCSKFQHRWHMHYFFKMPTIFFLFFFFFL